MTSEAALLYNLNKKTLKYLLDSLKNTFDHPSSDSIVVRVIDSHAAAPGSIPGSGNETLSKFPKILFLIEELLSMLHVLIAKCLLCI